jgi:hypothetical protein
MPKTTQVATEPKVLTVASPERWEAWLSKNPIAYRLQTAKTPETRARRMHAIIEMLKRGEKFYE